MSQQKRVQWLTHTWSRKFSANPDLFAVFPGDSYVGGESGEDETDLYATRLLPDRHSTLPLSHGKHPPTPYHTYPSQWGGICPHNLYYPPQSSHQSSLHFTLRHSMPCTPCSMSPHPSQYSSPTRIRITNDLTLNHSALRPIGARSIHP